MDFMRPFRHPSFFLYASLLTGILAAPGPARADETIPYGPLVVRGEPRRVVLAPHRVQEVPSARQVSPSRLVGLPSGTVHRVWQAGAQALRHCYERAFPGLFSPALTVTLSVGLGRDGSVDTARITGAASPVLRRCLAGVAGRLRFPTLVGVDRLDLHQSITFQPSG